MKFTPKQYAQALMDSLESTDHQGQGKVLDNFVEVLVENNDLKKFEEIVAEFHKIELEKKGIKQVEITSAHPINKDSELAIIKELNKLVKGDLELKKKVDEKIIGGVVIRLEDKMLDASVKNNLEELRKNLTQ